MEALVREVGSTLSDMESKGAGAGFWWLRPLQPDQWVYNQILLKWVRLEDMGFLFCFFLKYGLQASWIRMRRGALLRKQVLGFDPKSKPEPLSVGGDLH